MITYGWSGEEVFGTNGGNPGGGRISACGFSFPESE